MDSYKYIGFVETLRESIPPKSVKVMAFIVTSSFFICSIFYFLNIFSSKPFIFDMLTKQSFTTPDGGSDVANPLFGYMQYMLILLGLESVSSLSYSVISLLIATATIFISSSSSSSYYYKKDSSFKEVLTRVARSWIRPLVTFLHFKLLCIVFLSIWAAALLVPLSMFSNHPDTSKFIIMFVLGDSIKIFPLFLSALWVMSFVQLVFDQIDYGIEALGNGAHLVMLKRLVRFLYYFLLFPLTAIIYNIYSPRHEDFGYDVVQEYPLHIFLQFMVKTVADLCRGS